MSIRKKKKITFIWRFAKKKFHLRRLLFVLMYCFVYGFRVNPFLSVREELTSGTRASQEPTLFWLNGLLQLFEAV